MNENICCGGSTEERCWFIFYALHNLVLFVQFKKREKHPWGSVIFS